jgi:hypothetical protein
MDPELTPEPQPQRSDSIQSQMREAFAAGWDAFLATHSGRLMAHGIKDPAAGA